MTSVAVGAVPVRLTGPFQPTRANAVVSERRNNLPPEPTPLIDRDTEIANAVRLLADQGARLVTLTGPGGVGKTRIALAVAKRLSSASLYPDGVWFVDLSTICELQAMQPAIVDAIGGGPGVADVSDVCAQVMNRHMLLVLDNIEQLLPGAAFIVTRLLASAPGVAVLVTSRSPLYLTWEHLFRIGPLPLPDPYSGPATRLDQLASVPSVALLLARARAAGADVSITYENAPSLVELVLSSGGLPLAIELLALRLALRTPAEALGDAGDEVPVLRDMPDRHQSIRAALDWSYTLLTPREQALFLQLAVFAGSWTLEGAAAIATKPTDSPGRVSHALRGLIDAGLVVASSARETRYTLLEPTRRYASHLLADSSEKASARRCWFLFIFDLAHRAERAFQTGDCVIYSEWVVRLAGYWEDVRALVGQCLDQRRSEAALDLILSLERFWRIRGSGREALAWLCSALAQPEIPTHMRIRALVLAGELAERYGDGRQARLLLDEVLGLARANGDREREAMALTHRAGLTLIEGDFTGALRDYDDALAVSRATAQNNLIAAVVAEYALHVMRSDTSRAEGLLRQAPTVSDNLPDLDTQARILLARAELAARHHQYELAASALEQALAIGFRIGSARLLSQVAEALTLWPVSQARDGIAAEVLGGISRLRWKLGLPPMSDERQWVTALQSLERQLGNECFRTSFERGAGRTNQDLVAAVGALVHGAHVGPNSCDATLSTREQDVLRLVAEGKTSKQIGRDMAIAERTVKAHVTNILNKLGVMTRAQALAVAVRQGLI